METEHGLRLSDGGGKSVDVYRLLIIRTIAFLGDVHLLLLVIATLRNSERTKQTSDVGWGFTFCYDHWNRVGNRQLTNLVALQLKNTCVSTFGYGYHKK